MLGRIRHIEKYNKQMGSELMNIYSSVDWGAKVPL